MFYALRYEYLRNSQVVTILVFTNIKEKHLVVCFK